MTGIILRMRNVSGESCRENQNTHFVFNSLFYPQKSCRLWQELFLEWEIFRTKVVEKIKTHILASLLPTAQSPSWEANRFAASQEIPRISRNPKVPYRTHMLPPPVSILGQPNPVHMPTYLPLEIHLNIIHPSKPRSSQFRFIKLYFPKIVPFMRLSG